ncbi:MAG: ACT domain-containing protein [Bryobacteraceae bacterium]|nr:ACT domain-containing protein [Bryobacteraceae bacterium]MDW8380465.1 ACT domain-containing protein [Bryobacterales bacterium]
MKRYFLRTGDAGAVLRDRSLAVEAQVRNAFALHLAGAASGGIAVLAVGGFGRSELFPHSDVDLCLLVESEKFADSLKEPLAAFVQTLWDEGLRLSHSVRTLAECCELHDHNVELNISLLDERFLAGDLALYARLEPKLSKFIEAQKVTLARHLCRLARTRHAQHQQTIYHLEPNVKEAPGGLRDLHLLTWLRKLQAPGLADLPWTESLQASRDTVSQIRCFLHYRSNRDQNVLSFDAQEELPEQIYSPFPTPEQWMREYYRRVRVIYGSLTRVMDAVEAKGSFLLAGFREWRSRLSNTDFTVVKDRVYFRAPNQIRTDPEVVLRLFQFVARHGIRLSLEAERQLTDAGSHLSAYFAAPRPLWPQLREMLNLPHAALALRSMCETGFLRFIFPEWEAIEACVIRDFFHRYTVDEHTIVAIENLQNLARATEPGRRRFATLLAEIEELSLLRLALLFHDVGKATKAEAHSVESARLAVQAMQRIQMPEKHRRMVEFLILQHLTLSSAMTTRDLDDPATARTLAEKVGTVEALRYLTLLTYADVSAVNPTALSPWRLEQLWRVYLTVYHELNRELQSERIQEPLGVSEPRASFLKGLPVRYLRTHTEEEIESHLQLEERRKEAEVALDLRKTEGGYSLTILAKDRLYLFASVAGTLASFGLNILKAEAFANQQGTILDTFIFSDPNRTLELNPSEVDRLHLTLERVLLGKVSVKDLLKHRPKPPLPSKRSMILPKVSFDNSASESATLLEITAEDRPGLLYDVASALSSEGCNIELVLVDTEAHKAMDVFYISCGGKKLSEPMTQKLHATLMKVLSPQP